MSAGNLTGGNQKPVCAICFEELRPIVEDLQSIPICGHVFHELCIQQWMEYCPSGKKPTCPVCKQSCLRSAVMRLYFQSTGDQTQVLKGASGKEVDAEELEKEVMRLGGKIAVLTTTVENQQGCIKKLNDELSAWKDLAKKEEARKEEYRKEKERVEQYLRMKTEELSKTSIECGKLQERSLGLAKELAALKLATDLNLGEEEMVKLASLGHGGNPQNTIDVLKKSLSLRNKSYKELMAQCNLLGRSDARAHKKLEKSKEKIAKLNTRLQELEKALEQKENEVLRNLKSSHKGEGGKPVEEMAKSVNHSDHLKRSTNCPAAKNSSTFLMPNKNSSTFLVPNERDSVIDLEADSCFVDEEGFGLSLEMHEHPTPDSDFQESPIYSKGAIFKNPEHLSANQEIGVADKPLSSFINRKNEDKVISEQLKAKKVTHVASATWMTKTIIIDDISKQTPTIAEKTEAQTHNSAVNPGGLFGSESANRTGKWCRSSSFRTGASNGELISVGSDGRGGRIKVLRDHGQSSDEKAKTLWPKKQKHGTKQSGQFHIEHFFKSGS